MPNICAIISGGEYSPLADIAQANFIIACDKGYEYALKSQVTPQILLGDFDSCAVSLPEGIEIIKLSREKDDTDTLAALRLALARGYEEIYLYCALGGRLDHLYANLQAAHWAADMGAKVTIFADEQEIYIFKNATISLQARPNYALSIFSLKDTAKGVYLKNVKYPVTNYTLTNTFPIGISNEWLDDKTAEITVTDGVLMVICAKIE